MFEKFARKLIKNNPAYCWVDNGFKYSVKFQANWTKTVREIGPGDLKFVISRKGRLKSRKRVAKEAALQSSPCRFCPVRETLPRAFYDNKVKFKQKKSFWFLKSITRPPYSPESFRLVLRAFASNVCNGTLWPIRSESPPWKLPEGYNIFIAVSGDTLWRA